MEGKKVVVQIPAYNEEKGKKKKYSKLTVIIPALNEETAIKRVIHGIPITQLKKMGYVTEIMVIDNGSEDRTPHIARESGARVIIQPIKGYGNAYKAGFWNVESDIIATGDADLTYPFERLPEFIKMIEKEKIDFLNTDRLTWVSSKAMHWTHQFGNWFLTNLCRLLWPNFPFKDSQSGMWIFKGSIWPKMKVKSSGMPFSQELKIEAYYRGFKCKEIPIEYRARVGKVKLRGIRDAFGNTLHLFKKRVSLWIMR